MDKKLTLEKFRENIWWQLGLLLAIAVVCGALIGLVWWISGLNRPQNDSYTQIYSANCTYEVDETFEGKTESIEVAGETLNVKSTEKIVASDGAKLVRVLAAAGSKVKLDMYVVVKDSAALYLYFVSTNNTWLNGYSDNIENNKLDATFVTAQGGVTITYNALDYAIKLALKS